MKGIAGKRIVTTDGINFRYEDDMRTAEEIVAVELAKDQGREFGMRLQKDYLISQAEKWCSKPVESAAFSPEQGVTQGQIKTAKELLEFLKR